MEIVDKKRFVLFWLIIILAFFCLTSFFYVFYQVAVPLDKGGLSKTFLIGKGEGVNQIAANLEERGLIRGSFWFKCYVWYKKWGSRLQAGEYSLNPGSDIPEIARIIVFGEANSQEIEATIPEGFNLKKIDARLAKLGLIGAGELAVHSELEGYLFPDTYRFNRDSDLDEIIDKMRDNFNEKLNSELREEIAKQGKTIEEIIIMASLIEKEVSNDDDRRIVSGIFWNRLAIDYPLQSCATIAYILEVDKWRYSIEDTKVDSSYNTYRNIGLPSGPICSPGLSAIKAAIYPEKTDYNFFLSKPDGETVFSRTIEEHNQNKIKYLQ